MLTGPKLDRRTLLGIAAIGTAAGNLPAARVLAQHAAKRPETKLHILGTQAGPTVGGPRHQTSYAIAVGGDVYVIDCGYGATEQLVRAGLQLPAVRNIYITHHHPDHTADLSALLYFSWYAGKESPLGLYGPPPLKQITANTVAALKPSIDVWLEDIGHKPLEPIEVHELSATGPVMQDENVRVRCALVNHPPVVLALGYRFDTADRSIAFSGDTTPMPSVVELARGADILVHEAIYTDAMRRSLGLNDARPDGSAQGSGIAGNADKLLAHVLNSHSPPEEVGRIAGEAGVKTLVFAHIAPAPPVVTEKMYIDKAAQHFKGEIIVANDLMVL